MTALLAIARDAATPAAMQARLLDAWRERPLLRTAKLIFTLSPRVAQPPPEKMATLELSQAQWLTAAEQPDPRNIDWLLADVVTAQRELSDARLEAITSWPNDPRVAIQLLEMIIGRPFSSEPNRPFWTSAFREIARRMDHSTLPVIERLLEGKGVAEFDGYIRQKVSSLRMRILQTEPLAPSAEEEPLLKALEAAIFDPAEVATQKTADDFLKEIWARPSDNGAREVFADWLIERNDPRGEFIALQLKKSRGSLAADAARRETSLLKEHAREWIGVIEPAIHGNKFRFERGFLFSCTIAWRRLLATPGLMTHPAWATVREYELDPQGERDCDAWLDHMISLGAKRR